MAEAERYLPTFVERVEELLVKQDLQARFRSRVRITGCPNGCARPYLAEIALIGRAPGRYTLRLGADAVGAATERHLSRQHRRERHRHRAR